MGEANKRGTYEERLNNAKPKRKKINAEERNHLMFDASTASANAIIAMTVASLMRKRNKAP